MRAVTWQGKRTVSVEEVPNPTLLEPTDAIIKVTSTAICGSDLHLYEVMAPFMEKGDILGHESMGIVQEVGRDVKSVKPGNYPFGYQTVKEIDPDQPEYLQVRYVQTMNIRSDEMTLGAHAEDSAQDQSDIIKYVDTVSIEDIATRVPWLEGSPELHAFKSHRLSIKASM